MSIPVPFRLLPVLFRLAALCGAAALVAAVLTERWQWRHILEPSGLAAGLLMAATLAVTPLARLAPGRRLTMTLQAMRRDLGLAAFGFATLHMAGTVLALGRLDYVIQGLAWTSIWTGWAAFVLLLFPAVSSLRPLKTRLGRHWRSVQRITWPAAAFTAWHWSLQSHGDLLFWSVIAVLVTLESVRLLPSRRRAH